MNFFNQISTMHFTACTLYMYRKQHWLIVYLQRALDVTLDLKDPQYPEHNLGSLELSVTLTPKEGDVRDAVRNLEIYNNSDFSFISVFSCIHHKSSFFGGITLLF